MIYRKSVIAVLTLSFAFLLTTSHAQAATITFSGTGDPSLHGTTGSLSINAVSAGTYDVVWSMDFDGYRGSLGNHQSLANLDRMTDGWSYRGKFRDRWKFGYRGKFRDENGWGISESGAVVPEPSAAIVFGAGLLIVGLRLRGDARSRLAAGGIR